MREEFEMNQENDFDIDECLNEDFINSIFNGSNKNINNFSEFKNAVKFGKINLNFITKSNIIDAVNNKDNVGFYNIIKKIRSFGILISLIYVIFWLKDYKILFIIPISFIIAYLLDYFWNRKVLTLIITTILIICISNYLNLNAYYKWILIFASFLQAMLVSIYNSFLTQEFTNDSITFEIAIENNLIDEVYNDYTKSYIKI